MEKSSADLARNLAQYVMDNRMKKDLEGFVDYYVIREIDEGRHVSMSHGRSDFRKNKYIIMLQDSGPSGPENTAALMPETKRLTVLFDDFSCNVSYNVTDYGLTGQSTDMIDSDYHSFLQKALKDLGIGE